MKDGLTLVTDEDGATLNPLRQNGSEGSPFEVENISTDSKKSYKWVNGCQAVVFVLFPQCIWLIDDAFIDGHFILSLYIQIMLFVVLQFVWVKTFAKDKKQQSVVMGIMGVLVVVYVVVGIKFRNPVVTERVVPKQKCVCGQCEYFTIDEISEDLYPSFFWNSKVRAMGVGVDINGTRLSRTNIIQSLAYLKQLVPYITHDSRMPKDCKTIISDVLASFILRPCGQSCLASNLSSASCKHSIAQCNLNRLRKHDFVELYNKKIHFASGLNLLEDKEQTELLYELTTKGMKTLSNLPRDKETFCSTPHLFTSDYNGYTCD